MGEVGEVNSFGEVWTVTGSWNNRAFRNYMKNFKPSRLKVWFDL